MGPAFADTSLRQLSCGDHAMTHHLWAADFLWFPLGPPGKELEGHGGPGPS